MSKVKMLMLADTNSGRRSAITGRHKWSSRALLTSVKKCDHSATWVILILLEALLDRVAGRLRGMRSL